MIIYKITNTVNGKIYIGQTVQRLKRRWDRHCSEKSSGCLAMLNAIKKYGRENFTIEQIDTATSLEDLNKKENEYILKYNSLSPNGYNLTTGGENRLFSDESKEKMSKSHTGKILSEEHKANISKSVKETFKNNPELVHESWFKTEEYQEWLKLNGHGKKGVKVSDEGRERLSKSKMGDKNPNFGKKLTEKQKSALDNGRISKPIFCFENGLTYPSIKEASRTLKLANLSIRQVLSGVRDNCRGLTFKYV